MAKRRANGEGNVRKQKNDRREGRYAVGRDQETGKRPSLDLQNGNCISRPENESRERPLALQNSVDIKTVSGMLGHYSTGFTLDTYTHIITPPKGGS